MTVEQLIKELQKIKVPAEVFFPNMEIDQLEPINNIKLKDKGNHGWAKPEYRYRVILS